VSRFRDRPFLKAALVGALVVSFGLAGCGRKGPLDPPPSASMDNAAPAARDPTLANPIGVSPIGSGGSSRPASESGVDAAGRPAASKGPDRPLFLDRLLN
jgi:predicted small lipoprotein YifL